MIFSGEYNISFSHVDKYNNHVVRIDQGLFDRLTDFFSNTNYNSVAWSQFQGRFFLKTKSPISRDIARGDIKFTHWSFDGKTGVKAIITETEKLKEILL